MKKVHIALLETLDVQNTEGYQAHAQKLAAFDATFQEGVAKLQQLAANGKRELDLADVVAKQRAFVKQAHDGLNSHQTKVSQGAIAVQRLRDFETQRQELDILLAAFTKESEAAMTEREDRGKTLTQSGNATVAMLSELLSDSLTESYPIVQGSYKLMRYLVQMQDIARNYVTNRTPRSLPDCRELSEEREGIYRAAQEAHEQGQDWRVQTEL